MVRRALGLVMLLAALVVACKPESDAAAPRICTPEAYVFCRCKDRQEGTKQCSADGSGFAACLPCDGSGDPGPGAGGSDGLGGSHSEGSSSESEPPPSTTTTNNAKPPDGGTVGDETADSDAGTSGSTGSSGGGGGGGGGGGTSTKPPKKDGGTSTQAPSEENAPHCKPLKNIAPRIEMQRIADSPKVAKGGKPVNGTYVQSWVIEFTGDDGEAGPSKHYSKETLELTGTTGRYVFEDDEGKAAAGGFRLTADGPKIEVAYECPAAEAKALAYDATESTLIIYDPPYARVFTRQRGTQ